MQVLHIQVDFTKNVFRWSCGAKNRKISFIHLLSYKILVWKFVYIENPVLSYEESAGRCETQLGLFYVSCWSSVSSPIPTFLPDMWIELYIASPEDQFSVHSVAVTVSWHIGSHCIIIIISCIIIYLFRITLKKSKLTLFRLSQCLFLVWPVGFRELFSNCTLERLLPLSTQSSLPPGSNVRTIWSWWTQAWWPLSS
jgi:hypothetical protein